MRNIVLLALLSSLTGFWSCSTREGDVLRVTSSLPGGIIPADTMLTLTFSRGLVRPDSVNLYTETPFIEFTPAVAGKFSWSDTSTLVFKPDAPFTGDTKFRARLNTAYLTGLAGLRKFSGPDEFSFATESFYLKGAEFFYDRLGEKRTIGIKANLEFTYAVNPADAAQSIRVSIDHQAQPGIKVSTTHNSRVIAVEIGAVGQTERDKDIEVQFDDRLTSSETNTRIRMDRPFMFRLPGIEELKIYGHDFGYDGTTSWITIRTSQEVDSSTARPFIRLDPDRPFTLEGGGQTLVLRGKFEPGTTFHLRLKKGLESVLQAKTQNDYDADIVIGDIKPSFRFASASGVYMLLAGQKKIEVRTVNLRKVMVRISQIFQNNLVAFLDHGRSYDFGYGDYDDEEGWRPERAKFRYSVGNFGRSLWYDSVAVAYAANQEVSTLIDLNPYLRTDYKGFYLVEIANPSEAWRSTAKLVSISDLGMIVKRSGTETMVFATSLETARPVAGAAINLVSTSNQVLASVKSDNDGVARFGDLATLAKGFQVKLVTAELENDFNFINLNDYRVESSRFDVDGKRDEGLLYDAFLYGDRNIYRPGETVTLSGIIRNLTGPIPAKMPVRLKVFNPRGTMVKEMQQDLNEEGSFETTFRTSATMQTGTYRFELYTGNDLYLTNYLVSVEDFVPDRLKVGLKPSKETARPGETIGYELRAMNFFGPPAADRSYEFEGTIAPIPYISKAFPEFRFADQQASAYSGNPTLLKGRTDAQGLAKLSFPLPKEMSSSGLLRARARVAVFDESGRPVYQVAQTTVYPKDYYIGIRNDGSYYCSPNSPQSCRIVAVDAADKPVDRFRARVERIRFEWHSVLRQHANDNTLRYVSERMEIVEKTDTMTLGKEPVEYRYSAPRSGEFVIRISKLGDSGYNQFYFYSYSWGTSDATSFPVDPEARVQIVLNDSLYAPGQVAKVLFQTPFSGRMLVTIERNRVFQYRYLDVVDNAASMEIPVNENYLPNVYVSAVLFRKIKDINIPLMAGHGFAPLMVEQKANRLDVSIRAPEKIRPKTRQIVTVRAGTEQGVFVTLAAVDEGICQVKNYKSPDPYKYFYAKRALQTETFDFFKHLLPEPARSSPGGGDAEIGKRVNPLGVQRFKPVALWSGILKTTPSGEVDVPLDVPEFSGELRLMALAYKGDRFGSAQRGMKVADPVVITPALPRFLSPGDSILMPVTAFNTTATPVHLKFEIETSGGLTALATSASLDLGANQEKFVSIPLVSGREIGRAVVKVRTEAFGERMESVTELPVRPISPYATDATGGFLEGGHTATQSIEDVYLKSGREAYVTMSPFPVANFAKELRFLVGYPHGCLEQTVSKAFPQIYLRDIAALLDPSIINSGSPTYFVNEAITKLTSMQLRDGRFAYWPGGVSSNDWSHVYATHFLLEARKAGYAVPEGVLKPALNALAQIARSKRTEDYAYYGPGQKVSFRRIADKSVVYALYVLAAGGVPDKAIMNFYRTERSLLTSDSQFLLAGAFALSGDRRTYLELLPPQFVTEQPQRETGFTFDSPVRANALILNVLLETDLDNPNIPRYMDYLSTAYKSYRWYSTQDDAFTLLAFGKAARMAGAAKIEGTVSAGEKSAAYRGGNQRFDIDPFGKTVTISTRGEGRVYYSIVTNGIRTDGKVAIEDKNLKIRREFFDRNGSPVALSSVKQNDLLIVKLTLNSSVNQLENIAITDLLPAGFEIENPRITETTNYAFIKEAATPEYLDIRDDRLNIYTSFRGALRPQYFYYMVRAVTAGTYQYAPVVAEAMYNADYYSASGQGKLKVVR
jgi:uncharacterized protein YfaS (alpha-2-macroglobulin family)